MTTATMPFFTIDTLRFSRRMQEAGLQQRAAEELAEAIQESCNPSVENFSTKQEVNAVKHEVSLLEHKLDSVEQNLSQRISNVEQNLSQRIDNVEQSLGQRIENVENKIVIKMFLMITAAIPAIVWLDKIIA